MVIRKRLMTIPLAELVILLCKILVLVLTNQLLASSRKTPKVHDQQEISSTTTTSTGTTAQIKTSRTTSKTSSWLLDVATSNVVWSYSKREWPRMGRNRQDGGSNTNHTIKDQPPSVRVSVGGMDSFERTCEFILPRGIHAYIHQKLQS